MIMKKPDAAPVCETEGCDLKIVNAVKKQLPKQESLVKLASFFKVMNDETRLRIIFALLVKELCVCDLAASAGISISAASHQLRYLRNMNVVKYRKSGKQVYYSLMDKHISGFILAAKEHVEEK
jgi:DNA-binding transcriptional ArsR family regulator